MIKSGLEFALFVILGWMAFSPETAPKNVLLVVYVVILALWFFFGVTDTGSHWFSGAH